MTPYCIWSKVMRHGTEVRCDHPAKKDGFCLVHHPAAKERRAAFIQQRQLKRQVEIEARKQANDRRHADADRMVWLSKHWNTMVADERGAGRVHDFITLNLLRLGGVRDCIDHLRGKRK